MAIFADTDMTMESLLPERRHTSEHSSNKELGEYDYDDFKQLLLDLHNELVSGANLSEFDAYKNFIGQQRDGSIGEVEGIPIRYPQSSDKEELLRYALEKAKQCEDPTYGAMLLSAGVVAVHPFLDGNGRISRAIYSDFMGMTRVDETGRRTGIDANTNAREVIDMGTAQTSDLLGAWQQRYPYIVENLDEKRIRVGLVNSRFEKEEDQAILREDALEGLSAEDRSDLTNAIGADKYGNTYSHDINGLMFATRYIISRNFELADEVEDMGSFSFVNIHDFLPRLSVDQKKVFVEALWLHRKLLAKATIDFLSDDFGGKEIVKFPSQPAQKMRDFVIEKTTNLHSSKLPN